MLTEVILRCRWLRQTRSYIAPVEIGAVMRGGTISQIVETGSEVDSSKFKKGDWVAATSGWQEYAVLDQKSVEKLEVPEGCVPLDFMSSLGMVALTAYFGITVCSTFSGPILFLCLTSVMLLETNYLLFSCCFRKLVTSNPVKQSLLVVPPVQLAVSLDKSPRSRAAESLDLLAQKTSVNF